MYYDHMSLKMYGFKSIVLDLVLLWRWHWK